MSEAVCLAQPRPAPSFPYSPFPFPPIPSSFRGACSPPVSSATESVRSPSGPGGAQPPNGSWCILSLKESAGLWLITLVIYSDVVLESGNVLESDSSPYFEDSDLDSYPEDSDSNPGLGVGLTQHCNDLELTEPYYLYCICYSMDM